MGIEYEAFYENEITEDKVAKILETIKNNNDLITYLYENNDLYHFKFNDLELRNEWPEDLSIKMDSKSCYVVFHNGALGKCNKIIDDLENIFKENDYEVTFEEL